VIEWIESEPPKTWRRCITCHSMEFFPHSYHEYFMVAGKRKRVWLLTSRCDVCGNLRTSSEQHNENLRRLEPYRTPENARRLRVRKTLP
jgi:hypothetical protein